MQTLGIRKNDSGSFSMTRHGLRSSRGGYPSGRILWGRMLIWGAALIAMFVVGFVFGASGGDGVSKETYDALQKRFAEESSKSADLQAQLAAAQSQVQESTQEVQADGTSEDATTEDGSASDGEADPDSTEGGTYEIESGDTYWDIAEKFYDDGSLYTVILDANGLEKSDPVIVGKTLEIPPKSEAVSDSDTGSDDSGSSTSSLDRSDSSSSTSD